MQSYLDLLNTIRREGTVCEDRTGVGTQAIFGVMLRHKMSDGIPALTTKRIHIKSVVAELLWFLSGSTNTKCLEEQGVTIWREWADEHGDLGPIYGRQWRSWPSWRSDGGCIDQIAQAVSALRQDPDSRRNIVCSWNVAEIPLMRLPPCHLLFQLHSRKMTAQELYKQLAAEAPLDPGQPPQTLEETTKELGLPTRLLTLQVYIRSSDVFLGLPFNILSYGILLEMFAQVTNHKPLDLVMTLGNTHIYLNHMKQVEKQLQRTPRVLPVLWLNPQVHSIFDFTPKDIELIGYNPLPAIPAPVAV